MALKIDNATAVYAIMLVLFVAGMWAILAYGSTLRAQPDLAGEWELARETADGQSSAEKVERVTIEQSGRFVRLRSRSKDSSIGMLTLKIVSADEGRPTTSEDAVVLAADGGRKAVFAPTEGADTYHVELPDGTRYRAQLVNPAHPRSTAAAAKPPTTAPTAVPAISHAP